MKSLTDLENRNQAPCVSGTDAPAAAAQSVIVAGDAVATHSNNQQAGQRKARPEDYLRLFTAWLRLFVEPGQVTELRALNARTQYYRKPHTEGGFYDHEHLPQMIEEALKLTSDASGVYFMLNPLVKDVLAIRNNRCDALQQGEAAGDAHIVQRKWLLCDADPIRVRGLKVSSTEEEKSKAQDVIQRVRAFLRDQGWPDAILADSGNGFHLLYRIDVPSDDGGLVQRVLASLADRFDTDGAKIDRAVHNPARICKLYGSMARKGESVPDRPHRRAVLLEVPGAESPFNLAKLTGAKVEPVPRELLEAVAGEPVQPTTQAVSVPALPDFKASAPERHLAADGDFSHRLLVERWLQKRGVAYQVKPQPTADGRTVFLLAACPFNCDHGRDKEVCIMQGPNGKMGAKCMHNGCAGKGWQEFKTAIGKPDCDDYDPPMTPTGRLSSQRSATSIEEIVDGPHRLGNLPPIQANKRQLREVTSDTLAALIAANNPPKVFQRGVLTRIRMEKRTGRVALEPLDDDALRGVLARVADWFAVKNMKGGPVVEPEPPPLHVVKDVAGLPAWEVPVIEGVIESPVFAEDGTLIDVPGFHEPSRLWLHLDRDLIIPPVSEQPTTADLQRAKDLLLVELLGDFPFVGQADKGDASRANAVAGLLLPFVRHLIDGPTPMALVSAPTEGMGKDLLCSALCTPATGKGPAVTTEFRDEAEAQKKLTAMLVEGSSVILLDNLSRTLDSAALAAVLTAETWTDRLLGFTKTVTVPVTCCWMATGNNPRLSKELVRRTYLIRLDAGVENPGERTAFRHPRLLAWAKEHRGELIWAALTLCQAWIAAGRPKGTQTMGSYEAWTEVMGGILDVASIPGFLSNTDELRRTVTDRQNEWGVFLKMWADTHGLAEVGVDRLYELAVGNKLLDRVLGDKGERSQRTKLGKALGQMRDKVLDSYRIVAVEAKNHSGCQRYRLVRVATAKPDEKPAASDTIAEVDRILAEVGVSLGGKPDGDDAPDVGEEQREWAA